MSDGKWYNEHLNISNPECICDKKIDLMLYKINDMFEQKISRLEAQILELKSKLIEQEVREQNMFIRKHIPVSFIPSHTHTFTDIRSNIINRNKKPDKQ